jgi:hypothetical protein
LSLVKQHLAGKMSACLSANEWKSLPEKWSSVSVQSQAWSLATIVEVFYALANKVLGKVIDIDIIGLW